MLAEARLGPMHVRLHTGHTRNINATLLGGVDVDLLLNGEVLRGHYLRRSRSVDQRFICSSRSV